MCGVRSKSDRKQRTGQTTPFELLYGHKPSLSHMMRFGQPVYVLDHDGSKGKFDSKTTEAFMIGYGSRENTYRCLLSDLKSVKVTPHVVPAKHKEQRPGLSQGNTYAVFALPEPELGASQDCGHSQTAPTNPGYHDAAFRYENETFDVDVGQDGQNETFVVDKSAVTCPDLGTYFEEAQSSAPRGELPSVREETLSSTQISPLSQKAPEQTVVPARVSTNRGTTRSVKLPVPEERQRQGPFPRQESTRES